MSKTLQVEKVSKPDDQKKDHMSRTLKQRERNSLKSCLHMWQENILTKGTSVSCALCLADGEITEDYTNQSCFQQKCKRLSACVDSLL